LRALPIHPDVFLLVFDYDEDQERGTFGDALKKLRDKLGYRVIAWPKAKDFHLTSL
jgi:hypothetical protein